MGTDLKSNSPYAFAIITSSAFALCSVGASNTAMIDLFTERAGIEIEIKPTVSESTDPQTSGLGI